MRKRYKEFQNHLPIYAKAELSTTSHQYFDPLYPSYHTPQGAEEREGGGGGG